MSTSKYPAGSFIVQPPEEASNLPFQIHYAVLLKDGSAHDVRVFPDKMLDTARAAGRWFVREAQEEARGERTWRFEDGKCIGSDFHDWLTKLDTSELFKVLACLHMAGDLYAATERIAAALLMHRDPPSIILGDDGEPMAGPYADLVRERLAEVQSIFTSND